MLGSLRRSSRLFRRLGCIQRRVLVGPAHDPDDPEFYERQQRFDDAEYELLVLMRQALSIPEGDLSTGPGLLQYDR